MGNRAKRMINMPNAVAVALAGMCLLTGCSAAGDAQRPQRQVAVAAAADLRFAFEEIAAAFQQRHPEIKLVTTYGSSGNFYAQLRNKAPFDLYLSADMEYPRELLKQGLAVPGSEFLYAVGQIVIWVPNGSGLDLDALGIKAVCDSSVKKLAIANPKHAPYGRAAERALKHFQVYDQVRHRLVLGENVAQTAQLVESGAADVGVIALSLALAPPMRSKGRFWIVPLDSYPRLEQGGVILAWARDMAAARELRNVLMGSESREVFRRYGFLLPGE